MNTRDKSRRGFTLVELAIVLLVLGILARSALQPLTVGIDHRNYRTANAQLEEVRQQVIGHVVARGVLPCPLQASDNLMQSHVGPAPSGLLNSTQELSNYRVDVMPQQSRDCHESHGLVPAAILGLLGAIDVNGALLDPWGYPYQFAVSLDDNAEHGNRDVSDWMQVGEAARVGLPELAASISICTRSVQGSCPARNVRANQIAFVVWSQGKDRSDRGDQKENQDGDSVFVLRERSEVNDNAFDDQLSWGSAADVMYWMLRAGWLP